MELTGPIIVKRDYLHVVCFCEGDDYLWQFNPRQRFTAKLRNPGVHFSVGDVVELPGAVRTIESVELMVLNTDMLSEIRRALAKAQMVQKDEVIEGYRYKLVDNMVVFKEGREIKEVKEENEHKAVW